MARPAEKKVHGLATGLVAALVIAGCGGDAPRARLDAGSDARASSDARDLRADSTDTAPAEARADLPSDRSSTPDTADATGNASDAAAERADGAMGGTSGNGAGGGAGTADAGTGGMGTGGTGTGGMGTGGMGTGGMGTGGTGTGGMGTGGMGIGGMGTGGSAGSEIDGGADAPGDASADVPQNGTGGAGGAGSDAATDVAGDQASPDCGVGCPANVRADALSIWLASDFGVQCDSGNPQRVTGWSNRGSNGGIFAPPPAATGSHIGPLCSNATSPLNGRSVLSFDAPGTDDLDGVLKIDLEPLSNAGGYTVFVVERRQANDEGYFLGSSINFFAVACQFLAHTAYRFGYEPPVLRSGPYVADQNLNCVPPIANPPAFSPSNPQAALDVELFDPNVGHLTFSNHTLVSQDDDATPIDTLPDGFIGRAFEAVDANTRHSRFHGDIAEIVIYAAPIMSSEIDAVSTYLRARWGLP